MWWLLVLGVVVVWGWMAAEDVLKAVYQGKVVRGRQPLAALLRWLGYLEKEGERYRLTERGRRRAEQLVRAHRLWERYLTDRLGVPASRVHGTADRVEHFLPEARLGRLERELGHPLWDPHGSPIPGAQAPFERPLSAHPAGTRVRVVQGEGHLPEDALLWILNTGRQGVTILHDGHQECVPWQTARRIVAVPAPDGEPPFRSLAKVPIGKEVRIVGISGALQGFPRNRLLELGFTPGTRVRPVLASGNGNPRAYQLRGTTVALRQEQARFIWVEE